MKASELRIERPVTTIGATSRARQTAPFLRGPVPLRWLQTAATLPGKASAVGVALWYLAGLGRTSTVSVPNKLLTQFGVDRFAKRRALDALAGAGLIDATHHRGRSPVVRLLTD